MYMPIRVPLGLNLTWAQCPPAQQPRHDTQGCLKSCESESVSHSWQHTLDSNLYPWNPPGKDTGVGGHSLLQGIFLTQGSNPGLPHCRQSLYQMRAAREAPS